MALASPEGTLLSGSDYCCKVRCVRKVREAKVKSKLFAQSNAGVPQTTREYLFAARQANGHGLLKLCAGSVGLNPKYSLISLAFDPRVSVPSSRKGEKEEHPPQVLKMPEIVDEG